jgi:hypothetical protein
MKQVFIKLDVRVNDGDQEWITSTLEVTKDDQMKLVVQGNTMISGQSQTVKKVIRGYIVEQIDALIK